MPRKNKVRSKRKKERERGKKEKERKKIENEISLSLVFSSRSNCLYKCIIIIHVQFFVGQQILQSLFSLYFRRGGVSRNCNNADSQSKMQRHTQIPRWRASSSSPPLPRGLTFHLLKAGHLILFTCCGPSSYRRPGNLRLPHGTVLQGTVDFTCNPLAFFVILGHLSYSV